MTVIIYGDFNCLYSYLASQRAGLLNCRGDTTVDWRAVEHDHSLPVTGGHSDRATWDRELAEVASLALPGERLPDRPPVLVSNTKAAVAAYAEAVSDGVAGELRCRLFRAIWVQGLHLSSAYEVRRLITGVMWSEEDLTGRLASPDIPSLLLRDPDLARIVRRSGGTIAPDGGPLTAAGWRRIRRWRQEWLALPSQVVPAVIGSDQIVRPGTEGLRYLADLASTAGLRPRLQAETAAGRAPGLWRSPGRPDDAASIDMAAASCVTWHAARGRLGLNRARASVTAGLVRVCAAGSDAAGHMTRRLYCWLISTTITDIN